ncbi:MAG: precorrin-2 C(20)-methyltransferase [Lachnospiraceae bacterium]|nr:precorrin-2 C(20)-methyltransferase [Lachnospiraceae bacterium]
MSGILYGVGAGPGDPELMTLKAVRLIQENEIIAVPGTVPTETSAYRIASQAVPELGEKTLLPVAMPMVMDREKMQENHEKAADQMEPYLQQGENIVFLTLGDPAIYSTFYYIQEILAKRGYTTELVSGIPSFCAAAARVNLPLAKWNEPLHILPAVHGAELSFDQPGTYVLMKCGSKLQQLKEVLRESGRSVILVEDCGMAGEKIYRGIDEIPDHTDYYSLMIVK